jgi:hypothetical protein
MIQLRYISMAVLVMSLLGSPTAAETDEDPDPCKHDDPPCGWAWGPISEERIVFSVERTRGMDPGAEYLRGFKLGFGKWDETSSEFGGGAGIYWLAFERGDSLDVYGVGVDANVLMIPIGPVRIGPRLKVGLEYRAAAPDNGLTGLVGMGIDCGVWLGRGVELAVVAGREFGFPSGTQNRVGFVFRLAVRPWWKPSNEHVETSNYWLKQPARGSLEVNSQRRRLRAAA